MEDERVLRVSFRNILKMGNKANTYKFALAKFLLEYSNKFTHDELKLAVKTKEIQPSLRMHGLILIVLRRRESCTS